MQPLSQDDDAIINQWRDEILSKPNAYIISRVGEVESKPNFVPFDERLNHQQIQKDMIPLVAQGIAEATVWIAFLQTTDEKIDILNKLITYYKNYKKSTWEDKKENEDDKIKKITAIDIFIIMLKDLKRRLQASKRCVRASDCIASATFAPYEKLGGSKRKTKQRKIKKTRKSKKSMTLKKRALK